MKIGTWSYAVAFAALLLAGCQRGESGYRPQPVKEPPPATVAAGEEKTLMPLTVGNQWTYELQSSGGAGTERDDLTFRVSKVTPQGNAVRATIDVIARNSTQEQQVWLVNDKGIFIVGAGKPIVNFSQPQPMLVFPPSAGATFNWSGTGPRPAPQPGPSRLEGKVLGPQEIDTLRGTKSAIAAESTIRWTVNGKEGRMISSTWWVPEVGLARFTRSLTTAEGASAIQAMRLKDYSLKK